MDNLNLLTQWLLITSIKGVVFIAIALLVQKTCKHFISAGARLSIWLVLLFSLVSPVGWDLQLEFKSTEKISASQKTTHEIVHGISTPASSVASNSPSAHAYQETSNAISMFSISGHSFFSIVWLIGCLCLIFLTFWQIYRFSKIASKAITASAADRTLMTLHKEMLGIKREIPLLYSSQVDGPLILGLWSPKIIMPLSTFKTLDDDQKAHVIMHELQHIKGRDILWNWLAYGITLLHWFNPLVWFAYKCFKSDIEIACDARVIANLPPADKTKYGLTLIAASGFPASNTKLFHGLGILENHQQLKHRLTMIKEGSRMSKKTVVGFGLVLCLMILGAVAQPGSKKNVTTLSSGVTLKDFASRAEKDLQTKILSGSNSDQQIQVDIQHAPITYENLLTQLQINGFTAFRSKDYIQIFSIQDARTMAPIVEPGKTYFADEFVTDYIKLDKSCGEAVVVSVGPLVPNYSFISTYQDAKTLIIVDSYSNIQRVKSVVATIEKNLDSPKECVSMMGLPYHETGMAEPFAPAIEIGSTGIEASDSKKRINRTE